MNVILFTVFLTTLDFGGGVRFMDWSQNNTDFNNDSLDYLMYNTFRFQLFCEAKMERYITAYLRLEYEGYLAEGGRYGVVKDTDDFHEINMNYGWIRYDSIWGKPLTLWLGRIPLRYGRGLLVHDYYDGFDGINFQVNFSLPYMDISTDIFGVKARETRIPSGSFHGGDNNLLGIIGKEKPKFIDATLEAYGVTNIQYKLRGYCEGYILSFFGIRGEYRESLYGEFIQEVGEDTLGQKVEGYAFNLGGRYSLSVFELLGDFYYSSKGFTIREHAAFWGEGATYDLVPAWGLLESVVFPSYYNRPAGRLGDLRLLDLACTVRLSSSIDMRLEYLDFADASGLEIGREFDFTFRYRYSKNTLFQFSTGTFIPAYRSLQAQVGPPPFRLKDSATAIALSVSTSF